MKVSGLVRGLALLGVAVSVGCQAPDRAEESDSAREVRTARLKRPAEELPDVTAVAGSALAYFRTNAVTEIRYVRFPSYVGIADAKPVRILSVAGLSPERDVGTLALLDKADIGSWKGCYEDDRVHDGMYWTVEVASGDKVIKRVHGLNAEPLGLRFLLKAAGLDRRRPAFEDD